MRLVKRDLLLALDHEFSAKGFKHFKVRQKFRREKDDRTEILQFSTVDWLDEFFVVLEFQVRFDSLENIKNEAINYESVEGIGFKKSDRKWTVSGSCEASVLTGRKYPLWSLRCANDIDAVVVDLVSTVDGAGQEWFEKFGSIENIFPYVLSEEKSEFGMVNSVVYSRYCDAVVIAHLLGKSMEEIDNIVEQKRPNLVRRSKNTLQYFDRVVEYIRE